MPIPSIPPALPMPIANTGDVSDIPETTPADTGQLSFQAGFPFITQVPLLAGGIAPSRMDFNAVMKLLSQHTFFTQSGGVYPWMGANGDFAGLNYLAGWHVQGTNGHEYIAKLPSGPDIPDSGGGFVGSKDPTTDDGTYWTDFTKLFQLQSSYELGEVYYFRHPILKPGFAAAQGGLINGIYQGTNIVDWPIWPYLQTAEGQLLLKTEAEWQAMSTAIWATLADGTEIGWDGIGGAPFFVQDLNAGTLRLPDLRGMHIEAAGYGSLGVGEVQGWGLPNFTGSFSHKARFDTAAGVFTKGGGPGYDFTHLANPSANSNTVTLDISAQIPVAARVQVAAWGALPCVYLGRPR